MEVEFKDIKVGETYGITYYRGINQKITGICMINKGTFGIFKTKLIYYWNNEYKNIEQDSIYYSGIGYRFFILNQKDKIQQDMENRSLNLIIEKLIGHSL